MNRKFWERVGGNRIRFYDEPIEVLKDETLVRITELQELLAAPDHIKAIVAQASPAISSEEEFEAIFQEELEELAERLDYWDMDTVVENVDVASEGWFNLSDGQLGPGVVLAVCGEEVGNEAAKAIDGMNGQNWQHDHNHDGEEDPYHEIIIDTLYRTKIDAIRINTGPTPGNPILASLVNVYIASTVNGTVNNPNAHVGVDLDFSDTGDIVNDFIEKDVTPRSGRIIRITIGATAHAQNHITLRELEVRRKPRTFNI